MSLTKHPVFEICPVYRKLHARYAVAFTKGDVNAIEEAFSRMQEIACAFRDGVRWAESRTMETGKGHR
jgi:hypothetical protein